MGQCLHCKEYKRVMELQEVKRIEKLPQKLVRIFGDALDKPLRRSK